MKPLAFVIMCLVLAGCHQGPDDPWSEQRKSVVPVTGFVMLNGEPLAGATVIFRSLSENIGASGISDENGQVSFKTYEENDGVVLGEHQVIVTKYQEAKLPEGVDLDEIGDIPEPKLLTPELYADFETSPLTVTVEESGDNEFLLDLR